MDNEDIVTQWCKASTSDINKLVKYFAKQPITIQISILKMHRGILFKNKDQMNGQNIVIEVASYIAMLLAIKYYYALEQKSIKSKFEDLSSEDLRNISIIQLEKFDAKYKQNGKRDILKHYWSDVRLLKEKNKSFRKIAKFLEEKHKFKISHSEIYKAWKELEINSIGE